MKLQIAVWILAGLSLITGLLGLIPGSLAYPSFFPEWLIQAHQKASSGLFFFGMTNLVLDVLKRLYEIRKPQAQQQQAHGWSTWLSLVALLFLILIVVITGTPEPAQTGSVGGYSGEPLSATITGGTALQILEILIIAVSVFLLSAQISAASYASVLTRLDTINQILIGNPELYERLNDPYPIDEDTGRRRDPRKLADSRCHLMDMILTLFEQAYYQGAVYRYLNKDVWNAWRRTAKQIMALAFADGYWLEMRQEYPTPFTKFIDEIRKEIHQSP